MFNTSANYTIINFSLNTTKSTIINSTTTIQTVKNVIIYTTLNSYINNENGNNMLNLVIILLSFFGCFSLLRYAYI